MTSGSLPSFTVLTSKDNVPGSQFEREPEEYPVGQLKVPFINTSEAAKKVERPNREP